MFARDIAIGRGPTLPWLPASWRGGKYRYGVDVEVPLHGDPPVTQRLYVEQELYDLVEWFSENPPTCRFVKRILHHTVHSDEAYIQARIKCKELLEQGRITDEKFVPGGTNGYPEVVVTSAMRFQAATESVSCKGVVVVLPCCASKLYNAEDEAVVLMVLTQAKLGAVHGLWTPTVAARRRTLLTTTGRAMLAWGYEQFFVFPFSWITKEGIPWPVCGRRWFNRIRGANPALSKPDTLCRRDSSVADAENARIANTSGIGRDVQRIRSSRHRHISAWVSV